jgi:hypothetical protein
LFDWLQDVGVMSYHKIDCTTSCERASDVSLIRGNLMPTLDTPMKADDYRSCTQCACCAGIGDDAFRISQRGSPRLTVGGPDAVVAKRVGEMAVDETLVGLNGRSDLAGIAGHSGLGDPRSPKCSNRGLDACDTAVQCVVARSAAPIKPSIRERRRNLGWYPESRKRRESFSGRHERRLEMTDCDIS